jgi:hypothetical protein
MIYKVSDLFKHYKFVIGRVYLRLFENFKNLNIKIWLQNVDLIDEYKFDIGHVNIQGVLEILKFKNLIILNTYLATRKLYATLHWVLQL